MHSHSQLPDMSATAPPIIQLMEQWENGDRSVENALISQVYPFDRRQSGAPGRRTAEPEPVCASVTWTSALEGK
jgi:hypothetical protein